VRERSQYERPFNSPLECGLRLLFVLAAAQGSKCDLQRLISYDYLLVHSGDVLGGPQSLHPAVPFRGGEFLVKRDAIQAGLNQMFCRELISKDFDKSGIVYQANELTDAFVGLMKTVYAAALRDRANWVVGRFHELNDEALKYFMTNNIGRWGAEFERLSAINDLEL
jgi:hypothetical protein